MLILHEKKSNSQKFVFVVRLIIQTVNFKCCQWVNVVEKWVPANEIGVYYAFIFFIWWIYSMGESLSLRNSISSMIVDFFFSTSRFWLHMKEILTHSQWPTTCSHHIFIHIWYIKTWSKQYCDFWTEIVWFCVFSQY